MAMQEELYVELKRKQELQILIQKSIAEIKELTYKNIGERYGRTEGSARYLARKLNLTSEDLR